jgi:signal transduction histidine kinase
VDVSIEKLPNTACMWIKDDGKSFDTQRALQARGSNRLGLLGMRERLEMVGGSFSVESAPGKGTTVRAEIPLDNGGVRGRGDSLTETPGSNFK